MTSIDTSKWKEFKLYELFDSYNGDADIQKEHINNKGSIIVSAGSTDNGIMGKSDIEARIFPANTITVDMFGYCAFREYEYKMVTHARVFSLCYKKGILSRDTGLFMTSILSKYLKDFSYNNMCSWNKIKNISISLPVKETEEIDFEYMEAYMKDVETKMKSSLSALQKCIEYGQTSNIIDITNWKEFKLLDLFEITSTKSLDKGNLNFVEDGEYDFIGRTPINYGVQGKLNLQDFDPNPEDTFSLVQIGNTLALWRENKWYASQNIFMLKPKIIDIKKHYLFFQAVLNRYFTKYGKEYSSYPTLKELNNSCIKLPVKETGEINFEYMEKCIDNAEKHMSKYVKIGGESVSNSIYLVEWKPFYIGDLFDIHPTKSYKDTNTSLFDNGKNPVIVNSVFNNGIGGYTTKSVTEKGNMLTYSDTVDANTIFYQESPFVGYSHVQGLYEKEPYKEKWDKYSLLFFATVFKKVALQYGFNYGFKFKRTIVEKLTVYLPVDINGEIDFKVMSDYMKSEEERANTMINMLKQYNI